MQGRSFYVCCMKLASEVHMPTNTNINNTSYYHQKETAKMVIKEVMRQKRFLLGYSVVSAVTGAYGLYLG